MKISLAQINTRAADVAANCEKILRFAAAARKAGSDLAVFPECALTGYPAWDLWENKSLISANLAALSKIAAHTGETAILTGYVDFNRKKTGKPLLNCAALLYKGKILASRAKTLLPTYDVFDERRYFESASENLPVRFKSELLGITICEDIWQQAVPFYSRDPLKELLKAPLSALINISASPYHAGKPRLRRELLKRRAYGKKTAFLYCNSVGGNDELVFDGNSFALNSTGVIARAKSFSEDLLTVDLSQKTGAAPQPDMDETEELFLALVCGIKDYARKCGFKSAALGLSGGIDSAVVCALAAEALGAENITAISMPSPFTSAESKRDARVLAKNLGVELKEIPITRVYKTYLKTLAPAFKVSGLAAENLQARIRGAALMAFSNAGGALLLSTGNKSEIATGYCTLYGDMCGGLSPLADVAKTKVYALARRINETRANPIPQRIISRPPSAELRHGQKDQDDLPPYEILDPIMAAYVEEGKTSAEIAALGFQKPLVERLLARIDAAEFKRRQSPPGLKVTKKAFGAGRRMPIARANRLPNC